MELNDFLKSKFIQLNNNNICRENEFLTYDNFKKFIVGHYNLEHMEKNNYIKFVKVKRQILKLSEEDKYQELGDEINSILKILNEHHTFPYLDIRRYMFKLNNIFKLIEEKRLSLYNTLKEVRKMFDLKNETEKFKMKILIGINSLTHRYTIYLKYSKQLINLLNKLIEFEYSYGIDHKLIELNNIERSFLGKKSEYTASKIITEYVNVVNEKQKERLYYFESNIDFLKLFNILPSHLKSIKGEVDGMIIYKYNDIYYIDKLIEVKSSIKATFEDIEKFEYLHEHIKLLFEDDPDLVLRYSHYIFTKDSFIHIIDKYLTDWIVYLCINSQDYIEKSHLYFSTCLKIIDDEFIKDFYVDKSEMVMNKKFNIICNSRDKVDKLFNVWISKINLGKGSCNIFVPK
jgi:hypothetical protein